MPLSPDPATADDCRDCPLHDRRTFLRDATLGVAAVLALLVLSPRRAGNQEWIFVLVLMVAVGVLVTIVALPN